MSSYSYRYRILIGYHIYYFLFAGTHVPIVTSKVAPKELCLFVFWL